MSYYDTLVEKHAMDFGLERALVHAIIQVESRGLDWAVRYEPNMRWLYSLDRAQELADLCEVSLDTELMCQRTSWGLMQVMGVTARDLGLRDPIPSLLNADTGIMYGCKLLRKLSDKYALQQDVISAYNAGSPRKNNNFYANQNYVNKVSAFYQNYLRVGI